MSTNTFIRTTENLSHFYRQFPIDFFLLDEEGQAQLYIVDDKVPGKTHHLIIANESERDLIISDGTLTDMNPSPGNHHFELRFRPGVLSAGHFRWISMGSGDWRLRTVQWSGTEAKEAGMEPGTLSLFLLYIAPIPLVLSGEDSILLPLHGIKAGIEGGSRGARVELRYQLIEADHALNTDPAATDSKLQYRQERLNILNQRGVKEIPLNASFKGTSTVLNDGDLPNTLQLQVSSLLRNDFLPLCERTQAAPTRFVLSFDTAEKAETWALTDHDNAAAIDLSISMTGDRGLLWHIEKETQGQTPQWILTLVEDTRLNPSEQFTIHISGLITSMPSGFTQAYLQYENIPGYWDGMLKAVIEKSPLQYQEEYGVGDNVLLTKMGIGTNAPEEVLHVNGKIKAKSILLENGIESMGFNGSIAGSFNEVKNIEFNAEHGRLTFNGSVQSIQNGITGYPNIEMEAATGNLKLYGSISSRHLDANSNPKLNLNNSQGSIDFNGIIKSRQQSSGTPKVELNADAGSLRVSSKINLGDYELKEEMDSSGEKYLRVSGNGQSGGFIPTGGIIMWSGSASDIPNDWGLCDGVDGRPDLRGRFIVGMSNSSSNNSANSERNRSAYRNIGATGGKYDVTLTTSQMPRHNHHYGEYSRSVRFNKSGEGESYNGGGSKNTNRFNLRWHAGMSDQGSGRAHENRPPYYVLAFIIKL